jgi:hypothetical protein
MVPQDLVEKETKTGEMLGYRILCLWLTSMTRS